MNKIPFWKIISCSTEDSVKFVKILMEIIAEKCASLLNLYPSNTKIILVANPYSSVTWPSPMAETNNYSLKSWYPDGLRPVNSNTGM